MVRNALADAGDGMHERTDLRVTVDVAGRRLVYDDGDVESIGFSTTGSQ